MLFPLQALNIAEVCKKNVLCPVCQRPGAPRFLLWTGQAQVNHLEEPPVKRAAALVRSLVPQPRLEGRYQ